MGKNVAVIGAGGIGYDVSDFLTHVHGDGSEHHPMPDDAVPPPALNKTAIEEYIRDWGIDPSIKAGGVDKSSPFETKSARKVYLLQRKKGKLGAGLGKTTGWIHRTVMKKRGVEEMSGCKYVEVNDEGLVIEQGEGEKKKRITLPVDTVVLCAGQECLWDLVAPSVAQGNRTFVIGGAQAAGELDAKRAIDQGTRLAAVIENASGGEVFEQPVPQSYKLMQFIQKNILGGKK